MVDEGRVARLLRSIDERVGRLAEQRTNVAQRRHEPLWLDGIKYLFVTAIEGCVDVAHHLAASERWGAPDTNAGAFDLLARTGAESPAAWAWWARRARRARRARSGGPDSGVASALTTINDRNISEICDLAIVDSAKILAALELAERDRMIAEAVDFFGNQPSIARYMQTLMDVGLGYVRLGQAAPTLSGGEAQRVKLSTELAKRSTGHTRSTCSMSPPRACTSTTCAGS